MRNGIILKRFKRKFLKEILIKFFMYGKSIQNKNKACNFSKVVIISF